jgi:Flp pilus assembly protein TadD
MITSGRKERQAARRRRLLLLSMLAASALTLGGCSSSRLGQFTGSLSNVGGSSATPAPRMPIADLARRYDSKPGEKRASLEYAAALRLSGQYGQAVAVLQRASIVNVGDREIAAAYGKALANVGRFDEASRVLVQAHTADRPDWRVLSTQGTIADQQGDHPRAREFYAQALAIAPNEPSLLNNLGLSHLLTRDLAKAETYLRQAASQPGADVRVRANLALALRLQGKNAEADGVDGGAAASASALAPVGNATPPKAAAPKNGAATSPAKKAKSDEPLRLGRS